MPLTDTSLRAAKAADKPQKLFDVNGLFLPRQKNIPPDADKS
jgi:hypothetical protein